MFQSVSLTGVQDFMSRGFACKKVCDPLFHMTVYDLYLCVSGESVLSVSDVYVPPSQQETAAPLPAGMRLEEANHT